MQAVASLAPGHAFRLLPTFEPVPLNAVLGRKGFAHHATCRGAEDWENLFFPDPALATAPQPPRAAPDRHAAAGWPAPKQSLDNRDLQPPEPTVRILSALEARASGEVREAWNDREPLLLYPELEARGAAIQVSRKAARVRHLIRRGS